MDYSFVGERVELVASRIAEAAARSGRDPRGVELLAVTKFHPVEAVEAAWGAGLVSFGESRVQEAESKFPGFLAAHPGCRLDMIGHIQSNKAKKAVALFSRLQSVDSAELLLELNDRAVAAGRSLEVLLELHTGEESKAGFRNAEALYRALELFLGKERRALSPRGLMTMAPIASDEAPIRTSFRALRSASEECRRRFGLVGFDVLSMGMSGDYEIAVEEGSTLVRVGTAIFGARSP